jgi:NAD(P)-dependent dehydrogenase (short-subunit alcohol dehydrogenase family)
MNIFNLDNRKNNTNFIIDIVSNIFLYLINNKTFSGYLLVFLHSFFGIFIIYNLIVKDIGILYYIYTIIWIIVIFSNYYFHGCILVKVEQKLFQDKSWIGPINMLFYFLHLFYKPDKNILNNFIKYFICAPVSTLIILKYIFNNNWTTKLIGAILMIILIPLLFIYSQYNIFDNILFKIYPTLCKNKCNEKYNLPIDYTKFNDKVIAITGCTSGIGNNIVYNLINNSNSRLILLNRNSKKQQELCEALQNNERITQIECDLSQYKNVVNAYKNIVKAFPEGIDVLINNAGIYDTGNKITTDGYNNLIQTNFISHALLIELFLNNIEYKNKNKQLEIVNISSISYGIPDKKYNQIYFNKIDPLNNDQHYYTSQIYYQQSKLALLLYTKYLNTKLQNNGDKNIKIFCIHPGICNTTLLDNTYMSFLLKFFGNTVDYSGNFIINMILNNSIKSNTFYGINIFDNSIETIQNERLINDNCAIYIYLHTKNIINNIIKKYY